MVLKITVPKARNMYIVATKSYISQTPKRDLSYLLCVLGVASPLTEYVSERSITNIRKNIRLFDSPESPTIPPGPPLSLTPIMLDALYDHLSRVTGLYLTSYRITKLVYFRRHLTSNVLFPRLAGLERQPSRKLKNKVP
jgi:hypothetical protein